MRAWATLPAAVLLVVAVACAPSTSAPAPAGTSAAPTAPPAAAAGQPTTTAARPTTTAGQPTSAAGQATGAAGQATAAAGQATGAPLAVTMIWTAVTGANGPLWTAYEEGYFKQAGLDVTLTHIASTSRAISAMLANQAQFGDTDPSSLVTADAEGGDVVLIIGLTNRLVFSVMAQPDISGPQDLKGKTLGITRVGSSTHTAALQALKLWNLKPDTDVTLVPLNEVPSILAGLQAKQVAAGVVSPPTSIQARDAGFKTLIDLAKDGPDYPSVGISTTRSFIQQHPDAVTKFVRGYVMGLQRFKTDKQTGMNDMNKYLQLTDQNELEATWSDFSQYLADPPEVPEAGMQNVITDTVAEAPKAQGTKPSDYMDMSFVKQIEAQ